MERNAGGNAMNSKDKDPIDVVRKLFNFLQGEVPEGLEIPQDHIPHLSEEHAWTVVWYIQGLYREIPDHIVRCDVCGRLFDTDDEGDCLDYGDMPYNFCVDCMKSCEYAEKKKDGQ